MLDEGQETDRANVSLLHSRHLLEDAEEELEFRL
jgi:hypothetical protein